MGEGTESRQRKGVISTQDLRTGRKYGNGMGVAEVQGGMAQLGLTVSTEVTVGPEKLDFIDR